jgi:methylthioribulose-1-phosphate dehydratase
MSVVIASETKAQAFAQLREVKQWFASKGWFPATSGNLSIRLATNSPYFAITASGKDKNIDTDDDFLIVDLTGKAVESTSLKPSAETLIHCELYRTTGCGAIFHVHTVFNNLVSEMYANYGVVPISDIELIKAFNIWQEGASIEVPILPNYADIAKIAGLIEQTLLKQKPGFEVPGLLLRKHGVCAWGTDSFAARRHLEAFEFLFEYIYRYDLLKNKGFFTEA